jgi:hypothetical protein
MNSDRFLENCGNASNTALGFFWMALWAFVFAGLYKLGYTTRHCHPYISRLAIYCGRTWWWNFAFRKGFKIPRLYELYMAAGWNSSQIYI